MKLPSRATNLNSTNRSWLKLFMIVVPILLIFLAVSYIAVDGWYKSNLRPIAASEGREVVVVVEPGSSLRTIAAQLQDAKVIRNGTVFTWYVERQNSRAELQAGTYRFNTAQSVEEIVKMLADGSVATNLFTILPGRRLDELEQEFIEFGFDEAEVSAAFNAKYDHPLFAKAPANATLEGYIFPETYKLNVDSHPKDILVASFDQFYKHIDANVRAGLSKQNLSLHQAVILSSIIEQESGNPTDNPAIAQVFLKRLKRNMALGSDVTFFYAAAVTGQKPSPELDSPYNTRIHKGLPPGPIGNFNLAALEAVVKPADTDWLYFVAGDDGKTYFSKTEEEHQKLVDQYCLKKCLLPE